jgi:hypothetical protein
MAETPGSLVYGAKSQNRAAPSPSHLSPYNLPETLCKYFSVFFILAMLTLDISAITVSVRILVEEQTELFVIAAVTRYSQFDIRL